MPELPEVETVRRGLEPPLVGRTIERVEILAPRLVQPAAPNQVEDELAGRVVERVARRGKYLELVLSQDLVAVHHLRMTGSFAAPGMPVPAHVRLRYFLEGIAEPVVYNDPRRFGTLEVGSSADIDRMLAAKLGPEPLDPAWSATVLRRSLRGRTAPIKAALLDQRVVAGLGNIYVDEACFLAGIRPDTPAGSLGPTRLARLVDAIRARLEEAIAIGGSTLRDYRGVEGEVGGMQERFVAYGRAGRPCLTCGTTMHAARIAGRGTSFCPRCQRR